MDQDIEPIRRRLTRLALRCSVYLLLAGGIAQTYGQAQTQPEESQLAETRALFGVRSASMEPVDGVYLLSARLHVPVDDRLRTLLKDGLALDVELEINVIRQRGYWLDEDVASLMQRYELRYHAVSDRYIVRNLNAGEQSTFPTLDAA